METKNISHMINKHCYKNYYKDLTENQVYIYNKIKKLRSSSRKVKVVTTANTSIFKSMLLRIGIVFFRILSKSLQFRIVKSISSIIYSTNNKNKYLIGTVSRHNSGTEEIKTYKHVKWFWAKIIGAIFKSILHLDWSFERVINLLTNSICCRDLAFAYNKFDLGYGKNKFDDISSSKKMSAFFAGHSEYITNCVHADCNLAPVIPEELNLDKKNFHESMHTLVEKMFNVEEGFAVSYNWLVRSHIMSLRAIKKDNKVIITVYDPTITTNHKRFVFTNLEDIKKLTIKDFIDSWLLRKIYDINNDSTIFYGHKLTPEKEQLKNKSRTMAIGG